MAGPVPTFLTNFAIFRDYSIPLPFLWTVTITNGAQLAAQIRATLTSINHNWSVKDAREWTEVSTNNILVAQEVSTPTETAEMAIMGPESNRGGYMPGYGVNQRTDFLQRSLTINFIETNTDIETEFFRPWIVAIGTDGLIGGRFKAEINLTQYDRQMKIRKQYKFTGAFPTSTEGSTLNYSNDDFIVKSVTFGYTKYDIIPPPPN